MRRISKAKLKREAEQIKAGEDAFRQGKTKEECPFENPLSSDRWAWLWGWLAEEKKAKAAGEP